ncbi:MAG: zinc-ribbon domain-containing protein [Ruminococcus sp.]|nr:zinc-ribbon domain-containing protein [Ruminococcus sp.]
MSEKVYTKKLTNSGGGTCALALIAFVLSTAAAVSEFIFTACYNSFYENKREHFFAFDLEGYASTYGANISMAVFTLVMTVWFFSSRKVKRAGMEQGLVSIFAPIGIAAPSGILLTLKLIDGHTWNTFDDGTDGEIFRLIARIVIYGVPVLSALFMIIAGITVLAKLRKGQTVETSAAGKKGQAQAAQAQEQMMGFGKNNTQPDPYAPPAQQLGQAMGQQMPGQVMPGQMPGQNMPGQMMPGQVMPGQVMPGQMMPGQMMPLNPQPMNGQGMQQGRPTGQQAKPEAPKPVMPENKAAAAMAPIKEEPLRAAERVFGEKAEEKPKKICPKCGEALDGGAMFCNNCGAKLG